MKNKSRSTEFDLSLYTAVFGVDLFYRKTGSNYKISRASFDPSYSVNTHPLKNVDFDGINVGIKGFNLYYIFNHRRFSYPAAFSEHHTATLGGFVALRSGLYEALAEDRLGQAVRHRG